MKKVTAFLAIAALASTAATGVFAGGKITPLKVIKSTQATSPASLGGLGAGASAALIIGGAILTIVVITKGSSSTTGT